MVVFWHTCAHLVVSYLTCAFEEARNHQEETATTALVDTECWMCQQQAKHPDWSESETMRRRLMTVENMEDILGISAEEPVFLDMVARFYARGDHKRWSQPGVAKAKYWKEDPYIRGLQIQSYLCTRGRRDFHMNPGYAFDVLFAMMKHYDRSDFTCLNWEMTGYRPPCDYFFVSSNMVGMMAGGGTVDMSRPGAPSTGHSSDNSSDGSNPAPMQALPSAGIAEQPGHLDYNYLGTGLSAGLYAQGQPRQPLIESQTSFVPIASDYTGLAFDGRLCEASIQAPLSAFNQCTGHGFRSVSPLGEPGPSFGNRTQALEETLSHQVSLHAQSSSLTHPSFATPHDGHARMISTSHDSSSSFAVPEDLNHQIEIAQLYNNLKDTINQIYSDPIAFTNTFFYPSDQYTRQSNESTMLNPGFPTEQIYFSPQTAMMAPQNASNAYPALAPGMLDHNPLAFPTPVEQSGGKGKEPIRDLKPSISDFQSTPSGDNNMDTSMP
jgi:hypothetical protein